MSTFRRRSSFVQAEVEGRGGESLMVMGGTIFFAPIGGVWLMYFLDFNLSVAVWVGFIALAGLAAETGVVMLVYLREAIYEGAVARLRPKLMTVGTTFLSLVPIMLGTETGTQVMKRIAAPMVGGLFSATLLTLIVLPAIYFLWRRRKL